MPGHPRKLLTLICEASLEATLTRELVRAGARGYTASDARGSGSRGTRDALWGATSNVRIEILCDEAVAARIMEMVEAKYSADYGIVMYLADVEVRRASKF